MTNPMTHDHGRDQKRVENFVFRAVSQSWGVFIQPPDISNSLTNFLGAGNTNRRGASENLKLSSTD